MFGNNRLTGHDLLFATNQVAEIEVRAWSPALNDPFTALDCINRIGCSMARLVRRPIPAKASCRDGQLRLLFPVPDFAEMLDAAFVSIGNYGRSSVLASRGMLRVLTKLAAWVERQSERDALRAHADVILDAAGNGLTEESDRAHRFSSSGGDRSDRCV